MALAVSKQRIPSGMGEHLWGRMRLTLVEPESHAIVRETIGGLVLMELISLYRFWLILVSPFFVKLFRMYGGLIRARVLGVKGYKLGKKGMVENGGDFEVCSS